MELVQIFLPLCDNRGTPFLFRKFEQVKERLVKEFGGVNSLSELFWGRRVARIP